MAASSNFGSLVNSVNFFIDTRDSEHEGDNLTIHLHNNALTVGEGQLFKICLSEFHMARSWPIITGNNNKVNLCAKTAAGLLDDITPIEITTQNYASVGDIAEDFSTKLKDGIQTQLPSGVTITTTVTEPSTSYAPGGTGTGIFKVTYTTSAAHTFTIFKLQCFRELSDSYLILGADGLPPGSTPASAPSSFDVDLTTANQIVITGRYQMQRTSDPYVYLRTDLRNNNIESKSLSGALGTTAGHTLTSNILAKIPNDFENIHFVQSGPHDEHFAFLPQKNLSTLRLFLTDASGRPIGRIANSRLKKAFGSGVAQSETGSLFFQATLRIDTIIRTPPGHLTTRPVPQTIRDGTKIGPLMFQNFGDRN